MCAGQPVLNDLDHIASKHSSYRISSNKGRALNASRALNISRGLWFTYWSSLTGMHCLRIISVRYARYEARPVSIHTNRESNTALQLCALICLQCDRLADACAGSAFYQLLADSWQSDCRRSMSTCHTAAPDGSSPRLHAVADGRTSTAICWQSTCDELKSPRPNSARSASLYWASINARQLSVRSGRWEMRHWVRCFSTWFMLSHALFVQLASHPTSMFYHSSGSTSASKYWQSFSGSAGSSSCWMCWAFMSYDRTSLQLVRPSVPQTATSTRATFRSFTDVTYTHQKTKVAVQS